MPRARAASRARRPGLKGPFQGLAAALGYLALRDGMHVWARWPRPDGSDVLAAALCAAGALVCAWLLHLGVIVDDPDTYSRRYRYAGGPALERLPPRLSLFGPSNGPALLRCPAFLFIAVLVPVAIAAGASFIMGGVRLAYGYADAFTWGGARLGLLCSAPGLVLSLLYLAGALEVVHALPAPREEGEAAPAALALPGAEEAGPMRALEPPKPVDRTRWAADGVAFWGGGAFLALAGLMMFLEQDEFDSILGVKLGGRWFHGTYWNNWWFVFYGVVGAGLAALLGGVLLYVVRLNRRED